jgi:hypothetical protein
MTPRIQSVRRACGGGNTIGFANVKLSDDLAAFNVKIINKAGKLGAYAPKAKGVQVVTFSPSLAEAIALAAIDYFGAYADERTA